jgi:hypothetical protein
MRMCIEFLQSSWKFFPARVTAAARSALYFIARTIGTALACALLHRMRITLVTAGPDRTDAMNVTRRSRELTMRKLALAMVIVLFAAPAGSVFAMNKAGEGNATAKQAHPPQKNATVEYKRAQKRINADYQADKSVCHSKKGGAETQCLKQAKARKQHAMADAEKANRRAQAAGEH